MGFTQTNEVDVVFSSEWDKYAQKTYYTNYGEIPAGDMLPTKKLAKVLDIRFSIRIAPIQTQ